MSRVEVISLEGLKFIISCYGHSCVLSLPYLILTAGEIMLISHQFILH